MNDKFVKGEGTEETPLGTGADLDAALRPPSFSDFTGQDKTLERLQVMVGAASKREEPLKHVLLCGPPGLGKPPSHILSPTSSNVRFVLPRSSDRQTWRSSGLLTNLQEGEILFIDEIHRIPKTVEEYLYSAMEDYRIDIMIDQVQTQEAFDSKFKVYLGQDYSRGLLTAQ